MNKKFINKHQGFTMIELIIVIALIGLLAVAALPRFANMTTEAKAAARAGVVGSLNSAIAISHAKWMAQGSTGTVTMDGAASAITMNAAGYPDVGTAYNSAATCQTLADNLLGNTNGVTVGYAGAACTFDNSWATAVSMTATNAT